MLWLPAAVCGEPAEEDSRTIQGFVRFLDVEGGCWLLVGSDGKQYHPINLTEGFAVDGLRVSATIAFRRDLAGICPGNIVDIRSIGRSGGDFPGFYPYGP